MEECQADLDCHFHYGSRVRLLFEATLQGVWLKSFIYGLRIMDSISKPLRIYCDSSAMIFMAKK